MTLALNFQEGKLQDIQQRSLSHSQKSTLSGTVSVQDFTFFSQDAEKNFPFSSNSTIDGKQNKLFLQCSLGQS